MPVAECFIGIDCAAKIIGYLTGWGWSMSFLVNIIGLPLLGVMLRFRLTRIIHSIFFGLLGALLVIVAIHMVSPSGHPWNARPDFLFLMAVVFLGILTSLVFWLGAFWRNANYSN
jgi:hypothetical protein